MMGRGRHVFRRIAGLITGALLVAVFAVPTSAALAAGSLGSLSQLPSPNNCIGQASECGTTASTNLSGSEAVVVSPDGTTSTWWITATPRSRSSLAARTLLVRASEPEQLHRAEHRNLEQLQPSGSPRDLDPDGIAISPDGKTVYVVGFDSVATARSPSSLAPPTACCPSSPVPTTASARLPFKPATCRPVALPVVTGSTTRLR